MKFLILISITFCSLIQVYSQDLNDIQSIISINKDSALYLINKLEKSCKDTCADSYKIYALKGEVYESIDKDTALYYYSKSLDINKEQMSVLLNNANLHYEKKNIDKFYTNLQSALNLPQKYQSLSQYAKAYYLTARFTGEYKQDLDSAQLFISEAIKIEPNNVSYLKFLMDILLVKKECEAALKVIEFIKGVENNSNSVNNVILESSVYFNCFKEYPKGINILLDYYKKDSLSVIIISQIAKYYSKLKDWNNSISFFKKLLTIDSDNENTYYNLSKTIYLAGKKRESKKILREGISKVGENESLYKLMSEFYFEENNIDSSLFYLNKSIELNPSTELLKIRAQLYTNISKLELAYNDYDRILKITPCDCESIKNCINYEFDIKNYSNVIATYNRTTQCNCRNNLEFELISAYFYSGQYNKVNDYIDKTLESYPTNYGLQYVKALMLATVDNSLDQALKKCIFILNKLDNKINLNDEDSNHKYNLDILTALIYLAKDDLKNFYKTMNYAIDLYGKEALNPITKIIPEAKLSKKEYPPKIILVNEGNNEVSILVNISQKTREKIKKKYGL